MTTLMFITLLGKPMPERLAAFRKEKTAVVYEMLSQTAFDRSQNLQVRWRAVTSMGPLDATYFRADLENALKSKDWFMRNAALIAVLNLPREVALRWSMKLVQDPSLMVRTQAVRNLVGLDAREAEALLWKEIWNKRNFRNKESLWVRAHIAEALARMAQPGRVKHFERLLRDPDERLHKWAVAGLENTTGYKLSSSGEPVDIQRRKWLARLGVESI